MASDEDAPGQGCQATGEGERGQKKEHADGETRGAGGGVGIPKGASAGLTLVGLACGLVRFGLAQQTEAFEAFAQLVSRKIPQDGFVNATKKPGNLVNPVQRLDVYVCALAF